MSVVKGKHWPLGVPFIGAVPGDFRFSDERTDEPPGPPKYLAFQCPRGKGECAVPLHPQTTTKGHGWHWDGNREAPTLMPSINCLTVCEDGSPAGGCGWHGHLTAGEFREV